jgi:hypothetical protein
VLEYLLNDGFFPEKSMYIYIYIYIYICRYMHRTQKRKGRETHPKIVPAIHRTIMNELSGLSKRGWHLSLEVNRTLPIALFVTRENHGERFFSNFFSATQVMRGLNTNGQYLLQFPQNNIGDHCPPNTYVLGVFSSDAALERKNTRIFCPTHNSGLQIRPLTDQELHVSVSAFLDLRPDGYAKSVNYWQSLSSLGPWTPRRIWEEKKYAQKGAGMHLFWNSSTPCRRGLDRDPVQIHGRGSRFDLQCGSC